jgi:L-iditol 2-dehydrogenase
MLSASFAGSGAIRLVETTLPDPAPGEVRVRVASCCLCGSDLRPWRAGSPVTPGHEIAGRVAHPGHRLDGKSVAISIPVHCGTCAECRAGSTNVCANATDLVGWQRDGGYAEALNVPEQCLIALPDDIPLDLAPLLLDTVGTAAHGVRLARRVVTGGPALVLGAGPIGMGAILVLRRLGFPEVAVVEPQEARRRFAAELGASPVDPAGLDRRFPLVIEASGKDAARQLALDRVAPLGAVVQLGEAERWSIEETKPIRRKDFFYIRSFYFPLAEVADNIALLRADLDVYARFIDERVGLQGLDGLFQAFAKGERIKPALTLAI